MKNLLIVLLAYWISTNIYSQPGHYIFHEATNIKNQGYGFLHEAQNTKNLVNGIIYEMIQDELGFLWMATNGGLYRYDGSGVLNIRQEPFNSNSLSDNSLADLVQDQMGNIWLATFNGLNMYNPQTGKIRHYFPGDSTAINQSIYQLVRDSLNRLWIAVNSSELYTLDLDRYYGDESLRDKPEFNKTGFSDIMSLFVDAKNNVMLIQKRKLFILADGLAPVKDNFRRILFDAGLDHYPSCGSNHMYQDMYGNYWIGGFRSVFWVPNRELDMNTDSDTIIARVRLHRFDDVWPEQKSYYIEDIVTRQNELWLGLLYKGGLSTAKFDSAGELSDPYTFPHLDRNTPGDKFPDYIADLFVDNSDNLWATNHEGGKYILYNWTPGFRSYHPTDTEIKLPTYQALINLFEDRSGIIWLCTNTDGLIHFNKETEEFGGGELIAGWSIYTGLEDRFNNFWVGGWLFLRVFNKDGNNLEAAPEDVVDIELPEGEGYKKNVSSLYEDESGLWVGADNCMYHISNLGSIKENMGEDLVIRAFPFDSTKYALNLVTAIETNDHFDSLNLLFLSTYRGIQVFNRKTETFAHMQYDPEIQNGLNVNGIFDLCIDGQNNIWIATSDGGLNKLIFMDTAPDDQSAFVPSISFPDGRTMYYTVTHLTKENGFPDDILSGLVLDRDDNLWINSGIGLIRYSLPEGGISYFSTINGNPFSPSEGLIMHSDGELCAIGNQLVLLDLNKLENQENKNPVLFTDLRIQQESVLPGESSFLKKSMPFSDYLEIPFRRKMDLIIEFALVNVRDPELHSYKYRLKGSDDEWIQIPSGAREAHFTKI